MCAALLLARLLAVDLVVLEDLEVLLDVLGGLQVGRVVENVHFMKKKNFYIKKFFFLFLVI